MMEEAKDGGQHASDHEEVDPNRADPTGAHDVEPPLAPKPPSAGERVGCGLAVMLILGGGAAFVFADELGLRSKAEVGKACTAERGCVEGADCMSQTTSLLPSTSGTCVLRCGAECPKGKEQECGWDCPAGLVCSDSHCLREAKEGESCVGLVACENDTSCLGPQGGGVARCRRKCSPMRGDDCGPDTTCTPVDQRPPGVRERLGVPMGGLSLPHFCLPADVASPAGSAPQP
jgi:hypothetical protein